MLFIKLSALYFVYFALLGLMAPFMGLYLDAQGFNLLEIAQLLSLLMVTKVIAPLLWGGVADYYQNSVFLVRFGAFAAFFTCCGFFIAESFWQHALVIVIFSFFWNAILPQIEVVTLYNLATYKDRYGRIRLWGSVGFIASVVGFGGLFNYVGIDYFSRSLFFVAGLIALISLFHFDEPKKVNDNNARQGGFVDALKRPEVVLFFIVCFLLQVSHGAYYTYFSIYLDSLSYDSAEIGWLWSLGVIAEVVMFLVVHTWFKRHSLEFIMLLSLSFAVVRWFFTAEFAENVWVLVLLQCLHAFSFGSMHACAMKFVYQYFQVQYQGRAQALYSSFGFGAGGALGTYVSGIIVSSSGYSPAFKFSSFCAMLAIFFLLPLVRRSYRH
jgi:PPP family 3-phenylpropionic acid transporter